MRLFHVLPILSLLFRARASSLDSRQLYAHPLDARDVSDVCTNLNPTWADGATLGTPVYISGDRGKCLCVSGVSQFVEDTPAFADFVDDLTTYIINNPPTTCHYPDHSTPMCVNGSPCGFTCTDGYTASPSENPTMCTCPTPNVICNGDCVDPSTVCPSSQVTVKRRWVGSGSCRDRGHGWAACGVYGRSARAWECVDTARDLESCGGCVLPLTPFSPIGQDCTAIPGVADVSCLSGECVVHLCMPGYAPSYDGTSCISTQTHTSGPHVGLSEDEDEYMQAIRFGLEHRPL